MKKMHDMLETSRIISLNAGTKDDVLKELCTLAATSSHVTDRKSLLHAIQARENIMSTGIGMGIAIPHAKIATVTDIVLVVGTSAAGIDYQALDDEPVYKFILIAASNTQGDEFLNVLGRIGTFLNDPKKREEFLDAQEPGKIMELLRHIDSQK